MFLLFTLILANLSEARGQTSATVPYASAYADDVIRDAVPVIDPDTGTTVLAFDSILAVNLRGGCVQRSTESLKEINLSQESLTS